MDNSTGVIKFNVSGTLFQVYFQTLKQYPNSLLWKLAHNELRSILDEDNNIFLDRNPVVFEQLLNLLRYQQINSLPPELTGFLSADLKYYNLPELNKYLPINPKTSAVSSITVNKDIQDFQVFDEIPPDSNITSHLSTQPDFVQPHSSVPDVPAPPSYDIKSSCTSTHDDCNTSLFVEVNAKMADLSIEIPREAVASPHNVADFLSNEDDDVNNIPYPSDHNSLIQLNVGGTHYTTTLATLTRYPSSMLGAMFANPNILTPSKTTSDGHVFIDRDGVLFRHVLNFLRTGDLGMGWNWTELDGLAREADFYQIEDLIIAVDKLRSEKTKQRAGSGMGGCKGVYLEVKDSVICFRGFHITTSLIGPMHQLCKVSPFLEEFQRTGSAAAALIGNLGGPGVGGIMGGSGGPSLWCNMNPFYTAWSKAGIEEIYLNSDSSISRLEWAVRLRLAGWQLVNTTTCCSNGSEQAFVVVDKWFYPGDILLCNQAATDNSARSSRTGGGTLSTSPRTHGPQFDTTPGTSTASPHLSDISGGVGREIRGERRPNILREMRSIHIQTDADLSSRTMCSNTDDPLQPSPSSV